MMGLLRALAGARDGPERQEADSAYREIEQIKHELSPEAIRVSRTTDGHSAAKQPHCRQRDLRKSLAGR